MTDFWIVPGAISILTLLMVAIIVRSVRSDLPAFVAACQDPVREDWKQAVRACIDARRVLPAVTRARRDAARALRTAERELTRARGTSAEETCVEQLSRARRAADAARVEYEGARDNLDRARVDAKRAGRLVVEGIGGVTEAQHQILRGKIQELNGRLWGFLIYDLGKDAPVRLVNNLKGISTHWQSITVLAALVVLARDGWFYWHFNFNVFDYYTAYSVSDIVMAAFMAVLAILLFMMIYAIAIPILGMMTTAVVLVVWTAGWFRRGYFACRKAGRDLLAPLLPRWAGLAAYLLHRAASVGSGAIRPLGAIPVTTTPASTDPRSRVSRLAWLDVAVFVTAAVATLFVLLFESQYQAHAICTGKSSIGIVVDPPLADTDNFTRIGSVGSLLFAIPPDSFDEYYDSHTGAQEQSTLDPWNDLVSGRLAFLGDHEVWTSLACPRDVVVLPQNRVLCMHDRLNDTEVCKPPVPVAIGEVRLSQSSVEILVEATSSTVIQVLDAGGRDVDEQVVREDLVREEIMSRAGSCEGNLHISEPIVFRPQEWRRMAEDAPLDDFMRRRGESAAQLYVFGFASSDGRREYNATLAGRRAATVAALITARLGSSEGAAIQVGAFGEDHLTNGVANSRSVRVAACSPQEDGATDTAIEPRAGAQ